MALPEHVFKSMESQGKAKREPSDIEKLLKAFSESSGKMSKAMMDGFRDAVKEAIGGIPVPQITVEAQKQEKNKPVVYKSIVTKRDDQGRILEITHEPI